MRSRIISLFCIVAFAASLSACKMDSAVPSGLEKIPPDVDQVSVVDGDSLYDPQTLADVEGLAEYIVKGKLMGDAKQKLYTPDSKAVTFGITVSSFRISHVFKGNLKEGDKISIAERYYTAEENGKKIRYELGYGPSVPNEEYIFFLIKDDDSNEFLRGYYTPSYKETGRYPVIDPDKKSTFSAQTLMDSELNLVLTDPDVYRGIYQEVIDKYMK